jgi:hypothetical protein
MATVAKKDHGNSAIELPKYNAIKSDLALHPLRPLRFAGRREPMLSNLLIWRHHVCASRCLAISADIVLNSLNDDTSPENAISDSLTADS